MKATPVKLAAVCVLALFALDASAQGYPRRDRGGSPRDAQQRDSKPNAAAAPLDPYAALERELPSLKVDLLLKADQVDAWSVFERDVRDAAELERARRRHLLALRDAGEKAPTALTLVATLAEEDRQKAEATLDLKRHLEALYGKLDDSQRRMLDRRVVQSQTDPLGR